MANPIRMALVGLGRAGIGMHLPELEGRAGKFRIVAVCEPFAERREEWAEKLSAKPYADIEELVRDPDVELVDIATRSVDHYAHTKTALLAGKTVFLEKPFGISAEEAEELTELGTRPGGPRLYVRHNRRFEDGFEQVNRIMDSGILGSVYEIRLARNKYDRRHDWQTLQSLGGGQLLNWGPHLIDHALQFCGGSCRTFYSGLHQVVASGDCEDHVKLVFTGVNGRIVDVEISGGCAVPVPEYTVYGTRGALVSAEDGFHVKYLPADSELAALQSSDALTDTKEYKGTGEVLSWTETVIPYENYGGCSRIWDALYETLREGKPFPITPQQALEVMRVISKAREGGIFTD
ncbi:MAG: Gfo/Idh/MocA family oxidoreductase [Clostridia bacterium]|nr:Gfo/Idh/MocA family oxidoreductase [Clostridia bacterium]